MNEAPPVVHAVKFRYIQFFLALMITVTSCTRGPGPKDWQIGSCIVVMHGTVCFASPPSFEWSFGSYNSVMCFRSSTVLRMHGTYFILGAPYEALLAVAVALGVLPIVVSRLRKRRKQQTRAT